MKHFTTIEGVTEDELMAFFRRAQVLADFRQACVSARNMIAGIAFYEPSTRTRVSFASAAARVGMPTIGFASPDEASVAKGESLADTLQMLSSYADLVILRHTSDGAAVYAGELGVVPVINGGDGAREHPTQTLADLFTIWSHFGTLRGLTATFVGDLRFGRTARGLASYLHSLRGTVQFAGPNEFLPEEHLTRAFAESGRYRLAPTVEPFIETTDILYVTRIQKERLSSGIQAEPRFWGYPLTLEVARLMSSSSLILHPLPRVGEIRSEVDTDPRAGYFQQAANAVAVRIALLRELQEDGDKLLTSSVKTKPAAGEKCSNTRCITNTEPELRAVIRDSPVDQAHQLCGYCDWPLAP